VVTKLFTYSTSLPNDADKDAGLFKNNIKLIYNFFIIFIYLFFVSSKYDIGNLISLVKVCFLSLNVNPKLANEANHTLNPEQIKLAMANLYKFIIF